MAYFQAVSIHTFPTATSETVKPLSGERITKAISMKITYLSEGHARSIPKIIAFSKEIDMFVHLEEF